MVVIISRRQDDTVDRIVQWLNSMSIRFVRIFGNEKIDIEYRIDKHKNTRICINEQCFFLKDITSFYFNGGELKYEIGHTVNENLAMQFSFNLSREIFSLYSYLFYKAGSTKYFGLSPFTNTTHNKLIILDLALKCGLSIPRSVIITRKDALIKYKRLWKRIITKSIDEGINISTDEIRITGQRTEEITGDTIKKMNAIFFPSFIQELIEKQYEVRIFYFRDRFYSIAIFSQSNQEALIDYRNNTKKIIRMVPYELPATIKVKIKKLMTLVNLNYGSIDLLYDVKGTYYFLEVNPYGQYDFVSKIGNFYIEKEIADYLK